MGEARWLGSELEGHLDVLLSETVLQGTCSLACRVSQNEGAWEGSSLLSNRRLCVCPSLITLLLEWETSMQALYCQDMMLLH